MPDDPESSGALANRAIGEGIERYRLAASRLNIELSLIGSQQTRLETDLIAASRLNIELSLIESQQTLLEAEQASADRDQTAPHRARDASDEHIAAA